MKRRIALMRPNKRIVRDGVTYDVDCRQLVDYSIYAGVWEKDTHDFIDRFVFEGAVVIEIGANIGAHTLLLAKKAGISGKVYAIETSDAIQVAREIARDNGLAERIEFLHDSSERITLPQPADVMVSDLRGVVPLYGRHVPAVIDARHRLLRPGGVLIPRRDEIFVAPVEAPDVYDEIVAPWRQDAHDLDMRSGHASVTQYVHRKRVDGDALLAAPASFADLDYRELESPDADNVMRFELERPGTLHGFAMWFDTAIADGITLSNAPGAARLIYGMNFLPLPEAVVVASNDRVRLDLAGRVICVDYAAR